MRQRDLLPGADLLIEAEQHDEAERLIATLLIEAGSTSKRQIIALLESIAEASTSGACSLGLALLRDNGVPADQERGACLLQSVVDRDDPENAAFAHNFLAQYYRGAYDATADLPGSLWHFESSGGRGNAEAAYNVGLFLERPPPGITRDVERAAANCRRGAELGSALSMTNLAVRT